MDIYTYKTPINAIFLSFNTLQRNKMSAYL